MADYGSAGRENQTRVRPASNTVQAMAKATVRLEKEERQILERLAPKFGGKEATVREALQRLAADHDRREAVNTFFEEWEAESEPLSPDEVAEIAKRCGL